MKSATFVFALVLILAGAILPTTLAPVHAQAFGVMNISVAGPGQIYWKGLYNGATYNSGWVSNSVSVTLPQGTMVTFISEPLTGHQFTNWILNGYDQGSDNPFVLYSAGPGGSQSVIANFDGTLVKNIDGLYTNPTITNPATPAVLSPPSQYTTIQVTVQGSGMVYWSTSYGSSTESGSTNSGYSILVPYGATVTFTATPSGGNAFNNWNVNSANVGSTNPYVISNTNAQPSSTVTAVFL
ncbi:MAG TPA: hypothetical protein VLV18_11435 [Terriglobales bacterium]|nr:hypothetical protein [Terriglobales bacterium]